MSFLRERGRYVVGLLRALWDFVVDVARAVGATLRLLVWAMVGLLLVVLFPLQQLVYVPTRALWLQRYGWRARFDDDGVTIYTHHRGDLRHIAYTAIERFDTDLDPPMWIWTLILRSGEKLPLPLADDATVITACARHGVVCEGLRVSAYKRRAGG